MAAAASLRGIRCLVCLSLGEHKTSDCPKRSAVGIPVQLQAPPASSSPEPDHHCFVPKDYLDRDQLVTYIVTRTDVPRELACVACDLLAVDAFYCLKCTSVICEQCLGPCATCWLCPRCCNYSTETIVIIPPLRKVIEGWFVAAAQQLDPYSVGYDHRNPDAYPPMLMPMRVPMPPAPPPAAPASTTPRKPTQPGHRQRPQKAKAKPASAVESPATAVPAAAKPKKATSKQQQRHHKVSC